MPLQSVDLDHPRCFDFLREDLTHVNDFFGRKGACAVPLRSFRPRLLRPCLSAAGVATATERELFDFVTDPTIGPHNIEACLDRLIAVATERAESGTQCVRASARALLQAYALTLRRAAGRLRRRRLRTMCSRTASSRAA